MARLNRELLIISHHYLSSLGRLLNTFVTQSLLKDMLQPVRVVSHKSHNRLNSSNAAIEFSDI